MNVLNCGMGHGFNQTGSSDCLCQEASRGLWISWSTEGEKTRTFSFIAKKLYGELLISESASLSISVDTVTTLEIWNLIFKYRES